MKKKHSVFFTVIRMFTLMFVGLVVASVVALSQINLDTLRGGIVNLLQEATGMPVQIDGNVSWKISLQPQIELNNVYVANASWAKNKYAYKAKKINVRLNLISLFRNRPTIHNIKFYDVDVNLEVNQQGEYSAPQFAVTSDKNNSDKNNTDTNMGPEKFPVKDMGFGGVEIKNLNANIFGNKYKLAGFNIRMNQKQNSREYSGWIKADKDVLPFILEMSEYNAERKVYPVRLAMSTGGDALIANIALEGTSKMPIDFIIKGDLPDMTMLGEIIGTDLSGMKDISVDIAGGVDRKKVMFRKSTLSVHNTKFTMSGDYSWETKKHTLNLDVYSKKVSLEDLFPNLYGRRRLIKKHELNVFKDIPLFGQFFVDKTVKLNLKVDDFVMYRNLNIQNLKLDAFGQNNHMRIESKSSFAQGDIHFVIDADIDSDGHIWSTVAFLGQGVSVGNLLEEIYVNDFLSGLPVNVEVFVQANGKNLSEVMSTVTGPVYVYSVGSGYAHSALVAYMYGTDFLTSLRHGIEDLFSSEKEHNQIKVSCMTLNAFLRDGLFETQNGFAIETNALNIRLTGSLNLGDEKMKLALTTVPVRGLKLSLTGKVMNSIELSGSLAEPNIAISGASVASKVASATGLGLLLAPLTGGISLVASAGIGLVAGDLLENWLADDTPCKTAKEKGAPIYDDDPDWFNMPVRELIENTLNNQ